MNTIMSNNYINNSVSFVVQGEPASKANARRLVTFRTKKGGNRPAFIKSEKAINYEKSFKLQCPKLDELLEGDLAVEITINYSTRRPDLDESVILDSMQDLIYKNDRQVKEKHIYHGLDKENPNSVIKVWQI